MSTLVIEHVPVVELPAEWQAKLRATSATRVTVRIEAEPGDTSTDTLAGNPLFGMWRDRDDMQDVAGYVRDIRAPRHFGHVPNQDD
jgi:hypothetical protein